MRLKDVNKQQAVIEATVKVVNDIGFASASISKIANVANVSVATIYIYYENKEDLMVNVYYEVKKELTKNYYINLDPISDTKRQLEILWHNIIRLGSKMPEKVSFVEQFTNSPYYNLIDSEVTAELTKPIFDIIDKGVKNDVLKVIPIETFLAFFIVPANFLGNRKLCIGFNINNDNINQAFELAWQAIKK